MPHHLQPVGDLQDSHTWISRVLHDQFLVAFGLKACVFRLDRRDFVQSLHHFVHILRESARVQINLRMLSGRLVEEHRRHAVRRQADLVRRDQRHVDRMLDEGVSVAARLVRQRRRSYSVRFVDESLPGLIVLGKSLMNRVHSKVRFTPEGIIPLKNTNFLQIRHCFAFFVWPEVRQGGKFAGKFSHELVNFRSVLIFTTLCYLMLQDP